MVVSIICFYHFPTLHTSYYDLSIDSIWVLSLGFVVASAAHSLSDSSVTVSSSNIETPSFCNTVDFDSAFLGLRKSFSAVKGF